MIFPAVLLMFLPLFTRAALDEEKCATNLAAMASQRFAHPDIERIVPMHTSEQLYHGITQQQFRFGPVVLTRTIKVPAYLNPQFEYQRISVVVRLGNSPWLENSTHKDSFQVHQTVGGYLSVELHQAESTPPDLPVSERYFAERFLPRRALLDQLKKAADVMGPQSLISTDRLSAWHELLGDAHFKQTEIRIDLTGLTHAEFATVLNTMAEYLDVRSKR